jgi:predicted ribosomally synthesized peptide with SipW-like signal peptide
MSNDFELSRRKALAALGSIGVASAGAGLGTSAYFSDQETFQNNRLMAGELDLKMDWEEHYSDWSADEGDGLDITMEEPENPDDYRRFPAGATEDTVGENPVWVLEEDVPQFMDNTAIDSLPDTNNDGVSEFPLDGESIEGEPPCEYLADVGDDDGGLSSDLRTDNEVTDPGDPLINLTDVKPGDFGEVTFSTHLCDNPGYLWINMPDGLTESENGVTEPEADDPDEDDSPGDTDTSGELAETIQTALWYDTDCDNLPNGDGQPVDVLVVADTSASISSSEIDTIESAGEAFANELPRDGSVEAGFMTFNGPGEGFDTTNPFAGINLEDPIGPVSQFDVGGTPEFEDRLPDSGLGSTPIPAALDLGRTYLNAAARSNAEKIMVLVTDGGPDYVGDDSAFLPYEITTPEGSYTSNPTEGNNDGLASQDEQTETENVATSVKSDDITLFTVAIPFADNPAWEDSNGDILDSTTTPTATQALVDFLRDRIATPGNNQNQYAFDATLAGNTVTGIAQRVAMRISALAGADNGATEPYIFRGTLSELESQLTANNGLGIQLDGNPGSDERDCFLPGMVDCFGLSWWVPLDHGNEIQSDSVSFDLGFYTEQCRHNDGSGMNNDAVRPEETDA